MEQLTVLNPPEELVELLKENPNAPQGTFDYFLPRLLYEITGRKKISYKPELLKDRGVRWVKVKKKS